MTLESDIEGSVKDYAVERYRCLYLKLNVQGQRGWPDRMFLFPQGRVLFIEFKRPDEHLRRLQEYRANKLREFGYSIAVVDNVEQGRRVVDQFAAGGPVV